MKRSYHKKKPLLYLASQSPRRADILKKMGIRFSVVRSSYRERHLARVSPEKLVLQHASKKASKAILPQRARFVMGADTLVWYRDRSFGKPRTRKEAVSMLKALSGRQHSVYTGISLQDRKQDVMINAFAETKVTFKRLSEAAILEYFSHVNPFDKAGAYAIQEKPPLVTKIKGSYSNVIGLPSELLREMLKQLEGW